MKAAVITFPGSNCDRDLAVAFERAGFQVARVWHKDTHLPQGTDIVGVPGGFSYGDYLRCGAIAAQSPISAAIRAHAEKGGYVLGICNGFQVITEMGLPLTVASTASAFTSGYAPGQTLRIPVAHHDGNYTIDAEGLARLKAEDRIAFTYGEPVNGSMADIAGVLSENRRVLGLMPHPERASDPVHGSTDGAAMFASLMGGMALA